MAQAPNGAKIQRGVPAEAQQGGGSPPVPDGPTPPGKRRVEVIEVGPGAKFGGFASPIGGGLFGSGGKIEFSSPFGGGIFGNSQQRGAGNAGAR